MLKHGALKTVSIFFFFSGKTKNRMSFEIFSLKHVTDHQEILNFFSSLLVLFLVIARK